LPGIGIVRGALVPGWLRRHNAVPGTSAGGAPIADPRATTVEATDSDADAGKENATGLPVALFELVALVVSDG
jgi:hypothetical protein